MPDFLSDIALSILGLAGFALAFYIWDKKQRKNPLVCPLRMRCDLVTTSQYSKFMGIHLEILGMIYYAIVVLFHMLIVVFPHLFTLTTGRIFLVIAGGAFMFSLYLICVQAFILKQWCTWCLFSGAFCILIFLITYFSSPIGLLAF